MAKKNQLGFKEIEERLYTLRNHHTSADEVGYQLLYAFGKSEKDISRYKEGKGILKSFDGLLIKGLFCYRATSSIKMASELEITAKETINKMKSQPNE